MKWISTIFVEIEIPEKVVKEIITLDGCEQRELSESITDDITKAIKDRINAGDSLKVTGKTILRQ